MVHTNGADCRITIDGTTHPLSLTLACLAEIETGLKVDGFAALGGALKSLNANQLILVLTAMLRAAGASDAELLAQSAEPLQAAQAVARCFKANLA